MALRNIVTKEDSILRKKCREVEKFDDKLHTLLDDMAQTMYKADGVGLAGPQVGILRRVFVVDVGEGLYEMINPKIIAKKGKQTGNEGCLSCPHTFGDVTRPNYVKVEYFDRNGQKQTVEATELFARAICHENDHLDGTLFIDIATDLYEEK